VKILLLCRPKFGKMTSNRVLLFVRLIYALFFFAIGTRSVLVLVGALPGSEYPGSPETKAFTKAIFETGFISPVMSLTYFAAGILVAIKRTAPLGLVLLGPFLVSILLTQLMFEPNPFFGVIIFLFWVLLLWHFRKAYFPLWNFKQSS
jgi:hypothetical protein